MDILLDLHSSLEAIEVKSAMTFSLSFEDALKKIGDWVTPAISKRMVVYAGSLEDKHGDIQLVNYQNI